jgi:hypothetical protein
MDSGTFLLEREALERRMEQRRIDASAILAQRQNGWVPRLIRTGAGMMFGLGARGESAGWISSLVWSLAIPALIGIAKKSGDAVFQRIIQGVFSSGSAKES